METQVKMLQLEQLDRRVRLVLQDRLGLLDQQVQLEFLV